MSVQRYSRNIEEGMDSCDEGNYVEYIDYLDMEENYKFQYKILEARYDKLVKEISKLCQEYDI